MPDAVFQSVDCDTIYRIPVMLAEQGLDQKLASILNIWSRASRLSAWEEVIARITEPKREITVGFIGKYVSLVEAYKSLNEALLHGGIANDCRVRIKHIDSEDLEKAGVASLAGYDGILVAPGFGARGTEGKVAAVKFAREQKIPFFGICFGMQLACIEFARSGPASA
jgi:CTP synthase